MAAELHHLETRKNIGKARRLLHSLVPRAQCFCFYDLERRCTWSSDGAEDYEIDNYVLDLPDDAITSAELEGDYLRRTLNSGRTLLAMPVTGDGDGRLGLLIAVFSRNAGKSSAFNPKMLASLLAPAVELIGESLVIGSRLEAALRDREDAERELDLVYQVDEKIHATSRSHAGLAQLVGQSGRYLGIAYSVLLIPSKRIRVSATHSSWKNVNRKILDRYLVDQMLPRLEGQRVPRVFEIPGLETADHVAERGYQALLSPLFDRRGNLEGVLAQLGRVDGRDFSGGDRRFMAHIVRKVEHVIERSFDTMTGLMNRAGFEAQLRESGKSLEEDAESHRLIYFDLDNLQLVNDTFGRKAGDDVILRFAAILEADLPRNAVVSRLTGDDFCMLLTHATVDEALEIANRVRESGRRLRYLEGDKALQVTMSIGIAEFGTQSKEEGRALTAARMACESAKDHGRDRIEVFDDQNLSVIRRQDDMQLISQIQQALDADGFELLAQPIAGLNGRQGRPRFEVLLRMRDAEGNDVPTDAVLSAAERYHLMPQIDRCILSKAIGMLGRHAAAIDAAGANFAINLSGQSLGDDDILDFIDEEIRTGGVDPARLCFEITESAAVSNFRKAQLFIDALSSRGCRIALDDFGAGLSSFAYLKNFNVDTLKIDGSFIRDISENRISESMVAAITQVAKVMELETVAEYVESAETRRFIETMGVDYAQGHSIGKPEPLADVLQTLSADANASSA